MASVSYYSSVFKSSQSSALGQLTINDASGKRKREAGGHEDEIERRRARADSVVSGVGHVAAPRVPARSISQTSTDHQIPERDTERDSPEGEDSHGNSTASARKSSKKSLAIAQELATLRPPLNINPSHVFGRPVDTFPSNVGMRQHHLAVLAAILHRSVLEGDYLRAGRAWGMLLRSEMNGHSMDPRTNHRWGLGAEIHLQREIQLGAKGLENGGTLETESTPTQTPERWFGRQGFENAKEYYERLALQYPYRKAFPHATGPLDFHLAMFGLWIRSVLDILEEKKTVTPNSERYQACSDMEDEMEDASTSRPSQRNRHKGGDLLEEALQLSGEISNRLKEFLSSPPYSDQTSFWNLKGMVALWRTDIWRELSSEDSDSHKAIISDAFEARSREKAQEHVKMEEGEARDAFERVVQLGGKPSVQGGLQGSFTTQSRADLHSAREEITM